MSLNANQSGMDGVGHEIKTEGPAVSLKAKNIQTQKETFLRVRGLKSGATIAIPVIVKPGRGPDFYPPWEVYDPPGPIAGFSMYVVPVDPPPDAPVASFTIGLI